MASQAHRVLVLRCSVLVFHEVLLGGMREGGGEEEREGSRGGEGEKGGRREVEGERAMLLEGC